MTAPSFFGFERALMSEPFVLTERDGAVGIVTINRPNALNALSNDVLSQVAWDLFEKTPPGWTRVQAICDYVHNHITFGYEYARFTKTAFEAFNERTGVCRDYTHLAVTLCRCMNIPARYCTGYLGDIGIPPPYSAMDFAAWMEVYLGGRWYTFDPRNNVPRIGRVLIARGRDAADVAITTTFGPNTLESFTVLAEEVGEHGESAHAQS